MSINMGFCSSTPPLENRSFKNLESGILNINQRLNQAKSITGFREVIIDKMLKKEAKIN